MLNGVGFWKWVSLKSHILYLNICLVILLLIINNGENYIILGCSSREESKFGRGVVPKWRGCKSQIVETKTKKNNNI